ncbi:hypothetical protein DCO17_03485 [Polynucleobacter tropicus]|uniref:Uncharacterized protein n=2 Tax=Polynucleobacter tropicus TaxID=1743174 RepID=A0A6M9Q6E6_9BURK|nr:hypothetical protein DCO17_03485 [Polynucleobacter tropicus]
MEVLSKNSLTSDFTVLFQRIMTLAEELDGMREYYRDLYKKIEADEFSDVDIQELDLLKIFNVAGFVNLSIISAQAAQTAAIIANDVSLSRVFDPTLKTTERALRHIESGSYK